MNKEFAIKLLQQKLRHLEEVKSGIEVVISALQNDMNQEKLEELMKQVP